MFFFRTLSDKPLRIPRLGPYVARPGDPPIFHFNSERDSVVSEVVRRMMDAHAGSRVPLEHMLNDAAQEEIRRLVKQRDKEAKDSLGKWRSLIRKIARMTDAEKHDALRGVAMQMSRDIAGNFDPRVYNFASHVVPRMLTGIMQPRRLPRDVLRKEATAIDDLLKVEGHTEWLRRLEQRGTLVYVPTHSSNLDSIVLGAALQRSGLSPVVYGAGKNLFSNPILSFFMHNLGAYRVDRRIKAQLYKDSLKTYSQVMIERGYHSLFFPGGTRSRSGMLESKLKLGLAGSAIQAYSNNLVRGVNRPIYFVPTTINYAMVLEAETLVEDWLSEEGRARYIIEDDEFSQVDRWVTFFRKLFGTHAACVIRFGAPIDVFGNPIDDQGNSLTPTGRVFDPSSYVEVNGEPVNDARRDMAYTREVGHVLLERFKQETVVMTEQVVAHALFRRLVRHTPNIDIFSRLRLRGEITFERDELHREVGEIRDRLLEMEKEGKVRISSLLRQQTPAEMVSKAVSVWNGYHKRLPARDLGVEITAEDPTLLLYYQNRMIPYAESVASEIDLPAAREISSLARKR